MVRSKAANVRILLTSSLDQGKQNIHILEAVKAALPGCAEGASVSYVDPQSLVQMTSLAGYDLLMYIGSAISEAIPHYMISSMARASGVPSVYWATDDPYEFDSRYRTRLYDVYISNDLHTSKSYLERDNVYHLPLATPHNDMREIIPHDQRARGMYFCGYPYANRKLVVEDLLLLGTFNRNDLIVSGPNWTFDHLNVIEGPTSHHELINTYANSEFVLNMGRTLSIANNHYNLVASTPGPRTFECAIAGTPQLYFGGVAEIEKHFVPGKEILVCESVDEIEDHLKRLRTHPKEWEAVAKAGQERALRDHVYESRVSSLMEILTDASIF